MAALTKSLVPVDPQNVSDTEMSNVLDAIDALASLSKQMIGVLKDHMETSKPLKPAELTKYWKGGILAWFTFLFDNYHPPIDADVPNRWSAISYVSCVFTYSIKADLKLVAETPGATQLATRLWLVTDYDYGRSDYSLARGWWDPALHLLSRKNLEANLKKEFYDVKGVSGKSMVNLILKRIDIHTEVKESYDQTICLRLLYFLDQFHILELSEDTV